MTSRHGQEPLDCWIIALPEGVYYEITHLFHLEKLRKCPHN